MLGAEHRVTNPPSCPPCACRRTSGSSAPAGRGPPLNQPLPRNPGPLPVWRPVLGQATPPSPQVQEAWRAPWWKKWWRRWKTFYVSVSRYCFDSTLFLTSPGSNSILLLSRETPMMVTKLSLIVSWFYTILSPTPEVGERGSDVAALLN